MNHLLRGHAPITDVGWSLIDEEAVERLTPGLGGRRLVDFDGPKGWQYSATNLGRVEPVEADRATNGVQIRRRRVLPLVELHADFSLSRSELRTGDRGALDVDFDPLAEAAQRLVEAENAAIFHGLPKLEIDGIIPNSSHKPIQHKGDFAGFPKVVATAVERLLLSGVGGPYGLALGQDIWRRVVETAEGGGDTLLDHLREIMGGPAVWAPGLKGAVLLSLRGGDFLFDSGQDLSVGYSAHDAQVVELYLEESFSFRVVTPEAAVPIKVSA